MAHLNAMEFEEGFCGYCPYSSSVKSEPWKVFSTDRGRAPKSPAAEDMIIVLFSLQPAAETVALQAYRSIKLLPPVQNVSYLTMREELKITKEQIDELKPIMLYKYQ